LPFPLASFDWGIAWWQVENHFLNAYIRMDHVPSASAIETTIPQAAPLHITSGTIYCMKNPMILGETTCKIGKTKQHVSKRLSNANSETFNFPEWRVEYAKEVDNVDVVEAKIHALLTALDTRMSPRREMFDVSLDIVKKIFDLVPGVYYTDTTPLPSSASSATALPSLPSATPVISVDVLPLTEEEHFVYT
jgi:hypothetical protein